jgi:hypothetical protein
MALAFWAGIWNDWADFGFYHRLNMSRIICNWRHQLATKTLRDKVLSS